MSSISPSVVVLTGGGQLPISASGRSSPADVGQLVVSRTSQTDGVVTENGAAGTAAPTPPSSSLGANELKRLVVEMQSKMAGATSNLEFSVDKDTGRSVVKVTERTTNEVIWQFPSEQALQVSKELDRYIGAFVSHKV